VTYVIPVVHPAALLRGGHPISDIIRMDLAKALRLTAEAPRQRENLVIVHPSNPLGLTQVVRIALAWLERWQDMGVTTAVDVETSSLNFFACKLYSIALSGEDGCDTAIAFTLMDKRTLPWDAEVAMVTATRALLANPRVSKLFHNAPYDFAVLHQKNMPVIGPIEDTQAYAHLRQCDIPKDLGFIGQTFLDVEPWKLNHEGKKQAFTTDAIELLIYNAKDALNTMKLRRPLLESLAGRGCTPALLEFQNGMARLAARMELTGLPINFEKRRAMGKKLLVKLEELRGRMCSYLSWPDFNPMNKNHAVRALYDRKYLGLMPTAWTPKTKQPSTKYEHIIDHMENPFVKSFIDYVENHHVHATQYREEPEHKGDPKAGAYTRAVQLDGRLHYKCNPTGQKGSRVSTEPNCLSADTELLTEFGWLTFPEAENRNALAIQYNPSTAQSEISSSTQYVQGETMEWIDVKTEALTLRMTPNHRVLLRHNRKVDYAQQRVERTVCANDLLGVVHAGSSIPSRASSGFAGDGLQIPPEYVSVMCACQADGWLRKYGNGEAWAFYLSKINKIERLAAALTSCGEEASWYSTSLGRKKRIGGRKPETAFYIRDCKLKLWIDEHLKPNKEFGPWLLQWSTESLKNFVSEVGQWDGRASSGDEYSTTSKCNADWVQAAAVISGAKAGSVYTFFGNKSKSPCYQITSGWPKCEMGFARKHVTSTTLEHAEPTFCVTVPSGYIFVRRNGRACITGNCQNQRVADREFFEAPEGRVFIGSDKAALELRLAACMAGVRELLDEMAKPSGDPHRLAAINIYGDAFLAKTKEEQKRLRDAVKTTVYASLYRAGVKTVHKSIRKKKFLDTALRAALTLEAVGHIYHSFFGKYVEIPIWHDFNYEVAQHQGYVETPPFGRRRYFPVQPPPYTEVSNWIIQTAGSDIVGYQMIQIQEELDHRFHGDASIILHGHDALYIECAEMHAETVKKIVENIFGHYILDGPAGKVDLTADCKIAKNLKEAK